MICNDIYMVHRLPTLMLQLQTHLHTNLLGGGGSICMWSPVGACLRYCSRKDWNENPQISRGPLYSCMEDHQGSWRIIKQDDYILQMRVCQVNVFPKNAASSSCSLNSNALEFRWRNRWALHQPLHLSPRIPTGYRVCVRRVCVYINYIDVCIY